MPLPATANKPLLFVLADGLAVVLKGLETAIDVSGSLQRELLVIGDGPIGLMAVWVARWRGADAVTLVCKHRFRAHLALRLGASLVVDSQGAAELDRRFPVVIEAVGGESAEPYDTAIRAASVGGTLLLLGVPSAVGQRWDVRLMAYKELLVASSNGYTPRHFIQALGLLSEFGSDFAGLITHVVSLDSDAPGWIRDAAMGADREHIIKTVLSPRSDPHRA